MAVLMRAVRRPELLTEFREGHMHHWLLSSRQQFANPLQVTIWER